MQNQNDQKNQQLTSPMTLGQILQDLPFAPTSASTPTESPANSSTIGNQSENPCPTGKQLSVTVLESLRNIARSANSGKLASDRELETLLERQLGPQRFAVRKNYRHCHSDENGYFSVLDSVEIELDALHDGELALLDALEFLNRPCPPTVAAKSLAKMKSVMAERSASNQDLTLAIVTISERLERYPTDVVVHVIDEIIDTQKWFPDVPSLLEKLEESMIFRRAVLKRMQDLRNPLLPKNPQKQIGSDPRLSMTYQELPKKKWLRQHFDWWISDAEKMAEVFRKHNDPTKTAEWEAIAADRRKERDSLPG